MNLSCDFKKILDFMPNAFVIVNLERELVFYNKAFEIFVDKANLETKKRFCEVFNCVYFKEKGCGFSKFCNQCLIKNTIETVLKENQEIFRRKVIFRYEKDSKIREIIILISAIKLSCDKDYVGIFIEDITDFIKLKGLIPICANCKKIRNDKKYWISVEKYLKENFGDELLFSHGLCPECAKKLYKDYFNEDLELDDDEKL